MIKSIVLDNSKLYLSGIEIREEMNLKWSAFTAPNCTLVELKYGETLNIKQAYKFSKLYLSGIEMV